MQKIYFLLLFLATFTAGTGGNARTTAFSYAYPSLLVSLWATQGNSYIAQETKASEKTVAIDSPIADSAIALRNAVVDSSLVLTKEGVLVSTIADSTSSSIGIATVQDVETNSVIATKKDPALAAVNDSTALPKEKAVIAVVESPSLPVKGADSALVTENTSALPVADTFLAKVETLSVPVKENTPVPSVDSTPIVIEASAVVEKDTTSSAQASILPAENVSATKTKEALPVVAVEEKTPLQVEPVTETPSLKVEAPEVPTAKAEFVSTLIDTLVHASAIAENPSVAELPVEITQPKDSAIVVTSTSAPEVVASEIATAQTPTPVVEVPAPQNKVADTLSSAPEVAVVQTPVAEPLAPVVEAPKPVVADSAPEVPATVIPASQVPAVETPTPVIAGSETPSPEKPAVETPAAVVSAAPADRPIEFVAKRTGEGNLLQWELPKAEEVTNLIIEGSEDGNHFVDLESLDQSEAGLLNIFYDAAPQKRLYYRVIANYKNGDQRITPVNAVSGIPIKTVKFEVTPDPENAGLADVSSTQRIELYDMLGQLIKTADPLNGQYELDLQSLPRGQYLVRSGNNRQLITY